MAKIFVTGTAGFIGFHLANLLLSQGHTVHGYDGMTDYYDVALKHRRHAMLVRNSSFSATEGMLEDQNKFDRIADAFEPDVIIHLAAQAGVRYSLENPRAYLNSNVIGTLNVMDAARRHKVKHLLMASTSSVYGANTEMPFTEVEKKLTLNLRFMPLRRKPTRVWRIPMLICTTYLLQCSVSLLFMEPGDGLIWHFTNLYLQF